MIPKIITPFDQLKQDRPLTVLVEAHSRGVDRQWFTKNAAAFVKEIAELKPRKGYTYLHFLALGDGEAYGCFFAGASVQTVYGQKPIEQIQLGELVLTHKGRYRPVISLYEQPYTGDRVSLKAIGLPEPIVCTSNHPFYVVRRDGLSAAARFRLQQEGKLQDELEERARNAEKVRADEIRPGDYLVVPTELDTTGIEKIPEEYDPYVLGLYVAEGCLVNRDTGTGRRYKAILFTGSEADTAVFEYINRWLTRIGKTQCDGCASYASDLGVRMSVDFVELADRLDEWFGCGATTKHLHPAVWTWSREQRIKFLAGYFDGGRNTDRSGTCCRRTLTANTVSKSLAFDIQRLMASVDIPSSVCKCYNRESSGSFETTALPIYSINVGAYSSNTILEHTLHPIPHSCVFEHSDASSVQLGHTYALAKVCRISLDSVEDETKYNIEVEEDHTYSVDSVVVANSNRNFDYFPKKANQTYHHTFVKYGKVYKNHDNRDPSKASGYIVASSHNDPMSRVELLVGVDNEKWASEIEKLAKGEDIPVSMAAIVPFDICSICRHKSRTRKEYCDHLKYAGNAVTEDGRQVYAINDHPKFFDISRVVRPADRIAWTLRKVAGVDVPMSGAELAEREGLLVPLRIAAELTSVQMRKKAEVLDSMRADEQMIGSDMATVPIGTNPGDRRLAGLFNFSSGIPRSSGDFFPLKDSTCNSDSETSSNTSEEVEKSSKYRGIHDIWGKLASDKICLTPRAFFKIALGSGYSAVEQYMTEVEQALPGVLTRLDEERSINICRKTGYDPASLYLHLPDSIRKQAVDEFSILPESLENRQLRSIVRGVRPEFRKPSAAPISKQAEVLLDEYLAYKVSLGTTLNERERTLAVLQNYFL